MCVTFRMSNKDMCEVDYNLLQACNKELKEKLIPYTEDFLEKCTTNNLLSEDEIANLKAQTEKKDKVQIMLDSIEKKGHYDILISFMKNSQNSNLVKLAHEISSKENEEIPVGQPIEQSTEQSQIITGKGYLRVLC